MRWEICRHKENLRFFGMVDKVELTALIEDLDSSLLPSPQSPLGATDLSELNELNPDDKGDK